MRILCGGDASRTIARAFEARGHYAMSADFRPATAPGPHYQGDWADVEGDGWDMAVFHRTCTFMANSGSKHLYIGGQKANGLNMPRFEALLKDAWGFWEHMQNCPVPLVAWENPVMLGYAQLMIGTPSQTVQPWHFGTDADGPDNVKKATCWWLKGLPKLRRTGTLDGTTARAECHLMAPTKDPEVRRMARSLFTPGHADAAADQWGEYARERLAA